MQPKELKSIQAFILQVSGIILEGWNAIVMVRLVDEIQAKTLKKFKFIYKHTKCNGGSSST